MQIHLFSRLEDANKFLTGKHQSDIINIIHSFQVVNKFIDKKGVSRYETLEHFTIITNE